jgi:uncharacterized phage protein (TIGR01671 family)
MRLIKFRVWDIKKKQMFYPHKECGLFIDADYETSEMFVRQNIVGGEDYEGGLSRDEDSKYELQQFTGLSDKNGREIYEGDIVKIERFFVRPYVKNGSEIDYNCTEGGIEIGQIIWFDIHAKFLVSYEHIRYDDSEDFDYSKSRVEVIGNIFENPELLEVK